MVKINREICLKKADNKKNLGKVVEVQNFECSGSGENMISVVLNIQKEPEMCEI